jgi:hypothetical protein
MGQAAQGRADVLMDGRRHPLSLYLITGGESGERKTATDRAATGEQSRQQRELKRATDLAWREYNNCLDAWTKGREEALKNGKGVEAKRLALDALGDKPIPPLDPMLLVSEPTYEGIVKMLEHGQPSIGLFSNEGGRFLAGHAMSEQQRIKTLTGLNSLWDGEPIDRARAGDGTTLLYDRRLSLHLMVQPGLLCSLLGNAEAKDVGFLARCLISYPESTIGARPYKATDIQQDPRAVRFYEHIRQLLRPEQDGGATHGTEEGLRTLPLTAAAKDLWVAFHDHVEKRLADGADYATIRAFGAKAAEHALRIACTGALLDNHHTTHITGDHVAAGIELVNFYLGIQK